MTATLTDTTVLDELDDTIPCEDPDCDAEATHLGRCHHASDRAPCCALLVCDVHAAMVKRVLDAWLPINPGVVCVAHLRVSVLTWEPLR